MLPRQDFGRRHQCRLATGLDGARHGKQRDDGLAGADIALQQAQHAVGACQIVVYFGERQFLRAGQRIGKCRPDLFDDAAFAGERPSGKPLCTRPHQRQRNLPG